MTQVAAVPDRSLQQRREALTRANVVRSHHAVVKRQLKRGTVTVPEVMEDGRCSTMKVDQLLLSVPRVGRGKADRVLFVARISPSKKVGAMTDRQRRELLRALSAYPSAYRAVLGA